MKILFSLILLASITTVYSQRAYPFEQFPSVKYKEYKGWKVYDKTEREKRIHFTLTVPAFFGDQDTLTIQLTSFQSASDSSFVRIFRNKTQLQKITEPMHFTLINVPYEPVRTADINGDGLSDVKLVFSYMGNGLAALNQRVVYLFQKRNGQFDKVSFLDKIEEHRPERDLDGDGNFEIITMTLNGYQQHNYWTFNLFHFADGNLISQNSKFDYPIMIQYLHKINYKVTDKIPAANRKAFSSSKPEQYDSRDQ